MQLISSLGSGADPFRHHHTYLSAPLIDNGQDLPLDEFEVIFETHCLQVSCVMAGIHLHPLMSPATRCNPPLVPGSS